MKSLYFISFFALCIAFTSCKKETVEPDLSHFEGNFLCDVDYNYSHMGSNNKDYDQIIRFRVENDSLKVLNYAFPIESEDQTVFHIIHATGGTGEFKVTFSSNYNSVSIYSTWTSALSGPSVNVTYDGAKTTLPETIDPHPSLNELEGVYDLDVSYRNVLDSIDSQYVLNVPVTMFNNTVEIDNNYFYFGTFHSYFNQIDNTNSNNVRKERSIQWTSNGLDIDYLTITPLWSIPDDTVRYIISGTK